MSQEITPVKCTELIRKYDFPVRKKYGQNFLIDSNILESIVFESKITKDDVVLEIGPGMGSLTAYLLNSAKKVIAVEIDKMLIPILEETLAGAENLVLINDDILKIDLEELIKKEADGKRIKVVANLPYYITTPVIIALLKRQADIESLTVMVQKEVAERAKAAPGSKDYGSLSLLIQYYADPKIVLEVSRNCFIPRPDVDSAVLKLDIYRPDERPVKTDDPEKMFALIRAAFGQRRKTLANAVSNSSELKAAKKDITAALTEMGLSEDIRGQALTLSEFARLTELLASFYIWSGAR